MHIASIQILPSDNSSCIYDIRNQVFCSLSSFPCSCFTHPLQSALSLWPRPPNASIQLLNINNWDTFTTPKKSIYFIYTIGWCDPYSEVALGRARSHYYNQDAPLCHLLSDLSDDGVLLSAVNDHRHESDTSQTWDRHEVSCDEVKPENQQSEATSSGYMNKNRWNQW